MLNICVYISVVGEVQFS